MTVALASCAIASSVLVDVNGGGDYLTIQEGIDASDDGDTVLVSPGTYAGPENTGLDFHGVNLVLRGIAGAESTVIDCRGDDRGFDFHNSEDSSSLVEGFTVTNGHEPEGGGVRCYEASPTFRGVWFDGNSAGEGGGAYVRNATPLFDDCVFIRNTAEDGGGISCRVLNLGDGDPEARAASTGRGDYEARAASAILTGVTLVGNSAEVGGGIYCGVQAGPALTRCIIAFSNAGGAIYCAPSSHPTLTCCDLYGNAGGDEACGTGGDNFSMDPLFCDWANRDLRLFEDSPCLPAGSPCGELVGAFGPGDCPQPECARIFVPDDYSTIGEALAAATSCDTVLVRAGVYYEHDLHLPWGVTLTGPAGADSTVVDAGRNGAVVVIGFPGHEDREGPPARLDGLTITGASDSGIRLWNCDPIISNCVIVDNQGANGGGVFCDRADPVITSVTLSDNAASAGGGGIQCASSSPELTEVTFTENEADVGGGLSCDTRSSPVLQEVTFTHNRATFGGAVYMNYQCEPVLTGCVFFANSADEGGAIRSEDNATPAITNCTFVANAASAKGAGMCCIGQTSPVIENTIFAFSQSGEPIYCSYTSTPTVSCSDSYGNAWGDSLCGVDGGGNFSQDPLFCDGAQGDLRLHEESPCLIENSPCGVAIGALGLGDCPYPECGTILVPGDHTTIAEALAAASSCDTVLVEPGVYREHDLRLPWGVTLRSSNGPDVTTIDAELCGPVVLIGLSDQDRRSAPPAELDGFTIAGGSDSGVRIKHSDPAITDCNIVGNSAQYGGGINCDSSDPVLTGVTLSENTATYAGGGMFCLGSSPVLTNVTFEANQANEGGGLHCATRCSPAVEGAVFSRNGARDGGGVSCVDFCDFALVDCVFRENTATRDGGAINCGGQSSLSLSLVKLTDNSAQRDGGALYLGYGSSILLDDITCRTNYAVADGGGLYGSSSASVIASNSIFSGNTAGSDGGGVRVSGSQLTDCTFSGNTARYGGGAYLYSAGSSLQSVSESSFLSNGADWGGALCCGSDSSPSIENCTIVTNYAREDGAGVHCRRRSSLDVANTIIAFSLEGAPVSLEIEAEALFTCCDLFGNAWGDSLGVAGGEEIFSADPLLCDYPQGDLGLCPGSPCLPENSPCGELVGAEGIGDCPCPESRTILVPYDAPTIGEAVAFAAYGDTVLVLPGTYLEHSIHLPIGVALRGRDGPGETLIDARGLGPVVLIGYAAGDRDEPSVEPATLTGLTILGGSDSGVKIKGCDPIISDCIIAANRAEKGGGIRCEDSNGVIADSELTRNAAEHGGGIFCHDSSPTLIGVTINENGARHGAGAYCTSASSPAMTDVVFARNTAVSTSGYPGEGGGIYCTGSSPVLTRVTLAQNAASYGAGLSCHDGAEPALLNVLIAMSPSGDAISCVGDCAPTVGRSCVYGNAGGDSLCGTHLGNIFQNPRFCDLTGGDLSLHHDSPCLAQNNEWGEQIGAVGEGCSWTLANEAQVAVDGVVRSDDAHAAILLDLDEPSEVTIRVYDIAGRQVATVIDRRPLPSGTTQLYWDLRSADGTRLASGTYFCVVEIGTQVIRRSMALVTN